MTESKPKAGIAAIKEILGGDEDFLRESLRGYLQEVLESEMTSALGASKGARTLTRVGYRLGYYKRTLVTRGGVAGASGTAGSWRIFLDLGV